MPGKLRSLQVLRAVAALGVVFSHASPQALGLGSIGVDIFFVISGFIIAKVAPGRSPQQFLLDRAWRIYPPAIVASLLTLVLLQSPMSAAATAASLSLWPVYPGGFAWPYVGGGWTLCFEIMFYSFAALAIWRGSIALPLGIYAAALLAAFAVGGSLPAFIGSPMALEFLAGVVIARMRTQPRPELVLVCGLAALTWLPSLGEPAIALNPSTAVLRVIFWGVPAACIVYAATALERVFQRRAFDPLVSIGDASYSLYLMHIIALQLVGGPVALAVPAAVAGGFAFHFLAERPLLKARKWIRPQPLKAALAAQEH